MLSSQPEFRTDDLEPLEAYWAFYREVAARQLAAWLPHEPVRLLDLSGRGDTAVQAARGGHEVIHVSAARPAGHLAELRRRPHVVIADAAHPSFLAEAAVDAVVAEQLSSCLATESTVAELANVLRPGGRLLLRVDSLLLGMAELAQQQRWAELSDAPSAEVLLVPSPDGTITRCFWPEQLDELLTDAGLDVEWLRPRTVLSPPVVQRTLSEDPGMLADLVEAELSMPPDRAGESVGIHLVASARKPADTHAPNAPPRRTSPRHRS